MPSIKNKNIMHIINVIGKKINLRKLYAENLVSTL